MSPSAIQLDPALLAAGAWLWTGTGWVRCSGDSTGRLRVNLAGSEIILNTYTYPTAGVHNVSVQNWPASQGVHTGQKAASAYVGSVTAQIKSSPGWVYWLSLGITDIVARSWYLRNGSLNSSPAWWQTLSSVANTVHFLFNPALYFPSAIRLTTDATGSWYTVGYE